MRELVCLNMPNGPAFVDRLRRAWDDGDAIFPLDARLPRAMRTQLLDIVRPTIISTADGDVRIEGDPVESADALIMATSGSTGTPKLVVHTHDSVRASALATSHRLSITENDTWLACLPPAHIGGLAVIMRALVTGTRLIAVERFTSESYVAAARDGATLVSLVATALQRVDPSLYRTIVLGGARPPEQLPPNVVTTYGMTETGSGVVYDGLALDGVEIHIADDGEIHVRGPMLMRGYRNASSPFTSDNWFPTNDLGTIDEAGRLVVHGRRGDLIITGGENVWPDTVELVIAQMSGVDDVCVAGVDDNEWGQAVHAWVVTSTDGPRTDDVIAHVKTHLPAFCAPKHVHLVSSIPRTALGKPQRNVLRESLRRQ